MTKSVITQPVDNTKLFKEVSQLIESARKHSLHYLNKTNVLLYWHIGFRINQDILDEKRAKYGENIIEDLATKLQTYYWLQYDALNSYKAGIQIDCLPPHYFSQYMANHLLQST